MKQTDQGLSQVLAIQSSSFFGITLLVKPVYDNRILVCPRFYKKGIRFNATQIEVALKVAKIW